jgi:hypothetical protein
MKKSFRCTFVPLFVVFAAGGCNLVLGLDQYADVSPGPGGGATTSSSSSGPVASCSDEVKNGNETDTDCGGACPPCADGKGCETGSDCESRVCNAGGSCAAPECGDQTKNGTETDVDCGGTTCPSCGPDGACGADTDCKSGSCVSGKCESTCSDGVKGGAETDVDCGGGDPGCPKCGTAKNCAMGVDCQSGVCSGQCVDNYVSGKRLDALQGPRVVAEPAGGYVVAGNLTGGAINLGGSPFSDAGGGDGLLARFDPAGNHLWSLRFGDGSMQGIGDVALGSSGQIVVTGGFKGDLGLDMPTNGGPFPNAYVAYFDTFGKLSWRLAFSDPSNFHTGMSTAVDNQGRVVVAGFFAGSPSFGGAPISASPDANNIFVAQFGLFGQHVWSKGFGDVGENTVGRLAIDSAAAIVLTGSYYGTIDFGVPLTSKQERDVFLVKLDSMGNHVWSKSFNGSSGDVDFGIDVIVDGGDNVIVTGVVDGAADLGGGPLPLGGTFLAKFDAVGNHVWSKSFGDASGKSLATDASGTIYFAGSFSNTIDFGGGPLNSVDAGDMFLAKFDPDGAHVWSRAFGGTMSQQATSVAALQASHVLIVGTLGGGSIDLGGGLISAATANDSFIGRFTVP